MKNDFTIAFRKIVEVALLSHLLVIVDLSIVDQIEMRQSLNPHWLHAVEIIYNGKPVKCKAAVLEVRNCLHAKDIRSSLAYFHGVTSIL